MNKEESLKYYLVIFGLFNIFIFAFIIPLFFGDFLLWSPRNFPTEMMIGSINLAMGMIMLLVAQNPMGHKSFIDFIVISNVFHAIVMFVYAQNIIHIFDAIAVCLIGVLPLLIYPWGLRDFLKY